MMFERDPEEIGEPTYEEIELDMDVRDSIHLFNPGPDGRCREHLIRHGMEGKVCGSTQRWSVFHDNSADPREKFMEGGAHWHGGGDCMCFEGAYDEARGMDEPAYETHIVILRIATYEHRSGSPENWDWRTLLDLGPDENVEVIGSSQLP